MGANAWLGMSSIWILLTVWSIFWKGWALWESGRRNQKIWFVALLVVNTVGILEILYIFFFSKMKTTAKKTFSADEAKQVGEKLEIKWDKYDVEQFRMGMDVELEHGKVDPNTNATNDDPILTGKIALAHLNELRDYYTRLEKLEKEGKAFYGSSHANHPATSHQ